MSDWAIDRWAAIRGWMLLIGVAICIVLLGVLGGSVRACSLFEQRKLPMKFS
jgi:hypothetical protein